VSPAFGIAGSSGSYSREVLVMKRIIKIAIISSFAAAAILVFWVHTTPAARAVAAASPRTLFIQNCALCHGSDGRADTPRGRRVGAADLTASDVKEKSPARIIRTITNGRADMPAFGKKLTAKQIAALADYVRSL